MFPTMSDGRSVGFRPSLTTTEFKVLSSLATGRTRAVVANDLGRSFHTISHMISDINVKLGTSSLIESYYVLGWLKVPEENT